MIFVDLPQKWAVCWDCYEDNYSVDLADKFPSYLFWTGLQPTLDETGVLGWSQRNG
jgi:hypothetical protein